MTLKHSEESREAEMGAPRGMWPAVWPPNPTVTLADVWNVAAIDARHRAAIRARDRKRKAEYVRLRKDAPRLTTTGKIAFAGYDGAEA